jgi:membrane peptidoglycan carboxypeptidase
MLPLARYAVGPDRISAYIIYAVVAMEDANFFKHGGIDPKGIMRATLRNIRKGKLSEGGSTLTQQLAKMLFTGGKRTLSRKMVDMAAAIELEKRYSKEDILLMYLNSAFFGHGTYGVEAACRLYFDKSASDVTVAEAAMLAGILSSPNSYSPFRNPSLTRKKQQQVLQRMAEEGYIPQDSVQTQLQEFWQEHKDYYTRQEFSSRITRINRDSYLSSSVIRLLNAQSRGTNFLHVTYRVDTEFDLRYQELMKNTAKAYMEEIGGPTNQMQVAAVAMDPRSGSVLGMVGGNEYTRENQMNRAVQMRRQIGSLIKPFLYAAALQADSALSNMSVVTDRKLVIRIPRQKDWSPANYDNKYEGPITLEEALKKSKNSIAVQLLMNRVGATQFARVLRSIWGEDVVPEGEEYLSHALGILELTPLQVAQGYSVLANKGVAVPPKLIARIVTNVTTFTQGHGLQQEVVAMDFSYMYDPAEEDKTPWDQKLIVFPESPQLRTNVIQEEQGQSSATNEPVALEEFDPFKPLDPDAPFDETPDKEDFSAWSWSPFVPALVISRDVHDMMVRAMEREELLSVSSNFQTNEMENPGRVFRKIPVERLTVMLQKVTRRGGTAEWAAIKEHFTNTIASKTGTTSENRDAWYAAYSDRLVIVVWVGYDDNRRLPMGGPGIAAPLGLRIWKRLDPFVRLEMVEPEE